MAYLGPKAYPEHCQISLMERFCKNSYLAHFSVQTQTHTHTYKFPTFSEKKAFFAIQETETTKEFLIFQETELSYTSGKAYSEPWHNRIFL